MAELIAYTKCPACGSASIQMGLSARDHTVTQEVFEIWHCNDCTVRFTQHVPNATTIGPYYQSLNYVSHSDTDKGLINRLYHLVRNYTLTTKTKLLQQVSGKATGNLLDVGAGTGAFANAMVLAGWTVTGLEPDETARQTAKNKYQILLEPADHLFQLEASCFDAVTMWHVLEHVHNLHGYLEQFHHIIKPGGHLVIAVPNYTSYDAQTYGEYWAGYDVPRHLYHFSPESMEQLTNSKGFILETIQPMWFDSFYVSMLSEQYKKKSGNLLGAVWNGLLSNLKTIGNKRKCSSVIYIFSKE